MPRVAIVDYGISNLDSVARAVEECGGTPVITNAPADLEEGERIILPGVGAFPDGMRHLRERGFVEPLRAQVALGIPLLGICLGMQLLADEGLEGERTPGLALVPGTVRRLQPVNGERVPHVGWNEVERPTASPLFAGVPDAGNFYFVHSYYFEPADPGVATGWTPYCGRFVSAVARGNVYGVQFHPEKSQKLGFAVLRNFLALPSC